MCRTFASDTSPFLQLYSGETSLEPDLPVKLRSCGWPFETEPMLVDLGGDVGFFDPDDDGDFIWYDSGKNKIGSGACCIKHFYKTLPSFRSINKTFSILFV